MKGVVAAGTHCSAPEAGEKLCTLKEETERGTDLIVCFIDDYSDRGSICQGSKEVSSILHLPREQSRAYLDILESIYVRVAVTKDPHSSVSTIRATNSIKNGSTASKLGSPYIPLRAERGGAWLGLCDEERIIGVFQALSQANPRVSNGPPCRITTPSSYLEQESVGASVGDVAIRKSEGVPGTDSCRRLFRAGAHRLNATASPAQC